MYIALFIAFTGFMACEGGNVSMEENNEATEHEQMMARNAEMKEMATAYMAEVWGNGNLDAVDKYVAENCKQHNLQPDMESGNEAFKEQVTMWRTAFPDATITVDLVLVDGDHTTTRWTGTGTNTGDMWGMPATNKSVTFTGIDVCRWEEGKIVENWSNEDIYGMMMQLGVIPTPGDEENMEGDTDADYEDENKDGSRS